MTFSVLLIQNDQPRVVGTLWADNETNARALAPQLFGCDAAGRISVRRTDDREIPLRIASPKPMTFC